ncbi:glucose/ribitol dehydrogenase [Tanacetum coccineum]
MTVNRLVLEWEERIKLHLEREMEFNQWRSKNFKGKHPTLITTKRGMDDEGEVKIVNLTSMYGDLYFIHNEKLKEELQDIKNLTEERIDEIIKWFLLDFKTAKLQDNGWPLTTSAYNVSKAALNAYTRLLARKFNNIIVNCVHPGYVVTERGDGAMIYTRSRHHDTCDGVRISLTASNAQFIFDEKKLGSS